MLDFKLDVLVDGQYGSTGKGVLAGYMANRAEYGIFITNAGAQSGHTSFFNGKKIIAYHLSTAGIHAKLRGVKGPQYLSGGCIINPETLKREIAEFGYTTEDLFIHPHAAVIYSRHIDQEGGSSGPAAIAGTGKGVGAALAEKVLRGKNVAENDRFLQHYVSSSDVWEIIDHVGAHNGVLEIPQGMSLGINSGFYPHCTSRECTVMQGLADLRINPVHLDDVFMCQRTFPIRVGNTDQGNSGSWYPDQRELTWDFVGQEPETTTVTGRIRRIAEFSLLQYEEALITNRPTHVLTNFMNYFKTNGEQKLFAREISKKTVEVCDKLDMKDPLMLWGFGPNTEDIKDAHDNY